MSMRNAITFVLIIITLASCGQIKGSGYTRIIYSHSVKDSFELYITVPKSYDSNQVYAVFYYFDANLKSGKKLREMIQQPAFASRVNKTIFVGIGHRGDFHELRRRDFILPSIRQGDTSGLAVNYGQAANFYNFMKNELMPIITKAYKTDPLNNSIMGHSLGGLFVFYSLFRNDSLFRNYYALSPSLWVDGYSIYRFNKLNGLYAPPRNLYFSTGSLEIVNRIKAGTEEMSAFLQKEQYPGISVVYDIHQGENHNSQVEESLEYILKQK